MKRILLSAIFVLTLVGSMGLILADATNTTEGFAGSVQASATGAQIISANITLNISTQASCTVGVIYTETFPNNVTYGVFSIHAGNYDVPLNQQYGSNYYYCYNINNGSLSETFGAYPFTSGKGIISSEDMNTTANYTFGNVTADFYFGDGQFIEGIQHGQLTLFLHNETSDVSGSYVLNGAGNDTVTQTLSVDITADGQEYQNWTTDANVPSLPLLSDGIFELHVHARVTGAGDKDTTLQFKVYKTNSSGGDSSLLLTSEESGILTTSLIPYNIHFFSDETILETTDRLTLQLIVKITGGGANPTVELLIEGDTASRLEVPSPSPSRELFIPYVGAVRNVDLGSFNITTDCIDIDGSMRCTWSEFGNITGFGADHRIARWDIGGRLQDSAWEIGDTGELRRKGAGDGFIYLNDATGEDGRIRANSADLLPEIYMKDQIFIKAADDIIMQVGGSGWFRIKEGAVERWEVYGPTGDVTQKGHLSIKGKKEIRFYDNGNYIGFEPPSLSANQIWVLPDADGNANDALTTNGSGILSWTGFGGAINSTSWNRSVTNVFLANTGDYVGMGTIAPVNTLNIIGSLNATLNSFFGENVTASWFKGIFNWIIGATSSNYLTFNGTQLDFNETYLNETIDARDADTLPTKEFFIPATYGTGPQGVIGDHPIWRLQVQSAQTAYMAFTVPNDYTVVVSAVVEVITTGGQFTAIVDTDYGAVTEAYNTHSDTIGPVIFPPTGAADIIEVPINIGLFMAAGDKVGVKITEAGIIIAGDTDFLVRGVRFEYN